MTDLRMKKWSVSYTHIPTNHNTTRHATVEAFTAETARELVRRQLKEDRSGTSSYVIDAAVIYKPKLLDGKILNMG